MGARWARRWPSRSQSTGGMAQVTEEMSPEPGAPSKVLTQPRPGHADLPGMLKYGFEDALRRGAGLGPGTAARVAAGTLAKLLLTHLGVSSSTSWAWARRPRGLTHHDPDPPTSTPSTPAPCAVSTPRGRRRWSPPSEPCTSRSATPGRGGRVWPTACRSASAATCTGTASSTPTWRRPSCRSRRSKRWRCR